MAITKVTTPELIDLPNNQLATVNTDGVVLPKGLTTDRPTGLGASDDGTFRYNTTTKKVEYYDGAYWFTLDSSRASGQSLSLFNPVIYTGNGSTQNITTGFNPDFGMFKARNATGPWSLQDSVTGDFYLRCNSIDAAAPTNGYNVTSWTTSNTEITVKDDTNGGYNINGSPGGLYAGNGTYVGYVWKAGGAPTATNSAGAGNPPTSGSVMIDGVASSSALAGNVEAKKMSVNTAAQFSIVNFTSQSGATNQVPHGLSGTPDLFIFKRTDTHIYIYIYVYRLGC